MRSTYFSLRKKLHEISTHESTEMCNISLHCYECGDSYLLPTPARCETNRTKGSCESFEVGQTFRLNTDCPYCRRSQKRRKLPAKARGIYALS
ncbi:hypothetical protein Dda_0371 [Drechslerella dactyloides]|uniref:Uncharacterized protein n=1 Tax=Drechslerella dactyloides TaxID=74499 RepID=A0AAD6J4B8_DREDA|nr:hypothetical protein Dda_0371 [Drechslerella dactyloides]